MAKRKETSRPLLKDERLLDAATQKRLSDIQQEFAQWEIERLKQVQSVALATYTARLKSLKRAKTAHAKAFNEQIKRYERLIKTMEEESGGG